MAFFTNKAKRFMNKDDESTRQDVRRWRDVKCTLSGMGANAFKDKLVREQHMPI
jgi:hypothetical protein